MIKFPDFYEEDLIPTQPVNLYGDDVDVPEELPSDEILISWITTLAKQEGKRLIGTNYIFCTEEHLLKMNIEFMKHDYYTDILTFSNTEATDMIHGDMYISAERVADNATKLGVPFVQELLRVMIHGVLHLVGYGDKTPEEAVIMRAKEEEYLALIQLSLTPPD